MSVTSSDLLQSVMQNAAVANCEADWRGICSRAYYAIYQDGRKFHESLSKPGRQSPDRKDGGLHADLIDQLQNPTLERTDPLHTRSKAIGFLMKTLHARRVKADYFRDDDISREDAENSIAYSHRVIDELAKSGGTQQLPATLADVLSPVGKAASSPAERPGPRPSLTRIK